MWLDALLGIWLLQLRSKTTLPVRSLTFASINLLGIGLMFPMMIPSLFGWLVYATGWCVAFAIGAGVAGILERRRAG